MFAVSAPGGKELDEDERELLDGLGEVSVCQLEDVAILLVGECAEEDGEQDKCRFHLKDLFIRHV